MQRSIILFGLGLAILAGCNDSDISVSGVAQAQAQGGPQNVSQQLFGHTLVINVDEETGNTTSRQTVLAKGQPGTAQGTATIVFKTDFVFNPEGDCPPGFPLESEVISFEWGEIYNDGSLLAGAADGGQVLCLDLDLTLTTTTLTGSITGGTGRFEGASGTWIVEASSPSGSSTTTGSITVDLD